MKTYEMLANRIKKNQRKLKSWIKKNNIEAYRLYDKDIPEIPYIIDIYGDKAIVYEKGKKLDKEEVSKRDESISTIQKVLSEVFLYPETHIFIKSRKKQEGSKQYTQLNQDRNEFVIKELESEFIINPSDYLDVGLFLDHRPLREYVYHFTKPGMRILNLFCYTGSFSVHAAQKKALTVSVDLSKTYLKWSQDNFQQNNLDFKNHYFVNRDVFEFLKEDQSLYDLIILDPPSFSNSKKVDSILDIQRDHVGLIKLAYNRLKPGASLLFSTNLRSFKINPELSQDLNIKETTNETIPIDYRDRKIHKSYRILKS